MASPPPPLSSAEVWHLLEYKLLSLSLARAPSRGRAGGQGIINSAPREVLHYLETMQCDETADEKFALFGRHVGYVGACVGL